MIFGAFVRCQLKRTNNASKTLLYLVTANFIVSTAYLAVDVTASQVSANISTGVITASNTLYACIDLISQIILVNFLHRIPSPPLMRVPFPSTKVIPMLDYLAPTMGYGCPRLVDTCILRYQSA